jgi:hypothetical protein
MSALKIDPVSFGHNLYKTQQYCHLQMSYPAVDDSLLDVASIFRSFNPALYNKEIFEFGIESIRNYETNKEVLCKTAYWTSDPLEYDWSIMTLLRDQLDYKDKCIKNSTSRLLYKGSIAITKINETVVDGASAVSSCYLFDDYDLPPIDTWFYHLTQSGEGTLLFGWIPEAYESYANDAIAVNCLDCIGWFHKWYPQDYEALCVPNFVK